MITNSPSVDPASNSRAAHTPPARRRSRASRLTAFMPRFTAGIALAAALVLAPTVLPSGGDSAEARTTRQCGNRYLGCTKRCGEDAIDKFGGKLAAGTPAAKASSSCIKRTCDHQLKSCVDNASDAKKPTKAVSEPTGAGPKTKVQPKWQPGRVSVPDKVAPVTRVPPRAQPMGGVKSWPGSGGPTFRGKR